MKQQAIIWTNWGLIIDTYTRRLVSVNYMSDHLKNETIYETWYNINYNCRQSHYSWRQTP